MAATKYPTPTPELIESDLLVSIHPRAWAQWEGSSALLMSEGLIPTTFEWPHGRQWKTSDADGWHYWVQRCRPPGLKGPMSLWVHGDWWQVRRSRTADHGTGFAAASIYEKRRELEREVWRQSYEGGRMFNRYWKAHEDQRFQAFKRRAMGMTD